MAFTYFFRDAFSIDLAIKKLLEEKFVADSIRIWDAGCANGPETFTIALLLSEAMENAFNKVEIFATDIDENNKFGTQILSGIYPKTDLLRIPKNIFEKYFLQIDDNNFKINAHILNSIKFQKHDLLSLKEPYKKINFIVCKNVLLHFTYKERIEVIKMYHRSLLTNGLLLMEHTQKMPEELSHLFTKLFANAQVFQKK